MFTPPALTIDPKTVDWTKRAHVQNALSVLEHGGTDAFRLENCSSHVLAVAGSADTWELEAERAAVLGAGNFGAVKELVFTGVKQSNPSIVAGALSVALRFHTDPENRDGKNTPPLSAAERQLLIDVAESYHRESQFRRVTNQLTSLCSCWMALAEMEPPYGEVPLPKTTLALDQRTLHSDHHALALGREVFLNRQGITVLGMSVGSSRFNAQRTEMILEWLDTIAPQSLLMITDRPARHNREALGDSSEDAQRYCLKKGRQLREYANPVLESPGNQMQVFDWDSVYRTQAFQTSLEELNLLYQQCAEFRSDIQEQTRRVLSRESGGDAVTGEQIDIAKNYLLEEFAAIEALGTSRQSPVAYAYYTGWRPYESWVAGEYDGKVRDLGFVQYCIEPPVTTSLEEELEHATMRGCFKPKIFKTEAYGRSAAYPVTLTGSEDFGFDSLYFRVGKYLVVSPDLFIGDHKLPHEQQFDSIEFLQRAMRTDEVIFLADERKPSYQYSESLNSFGYALSNSAGCMIALQELGPKLAGRTIVDVGSRNLLLANTALREGASHCIAVETEQATSYFFSEKIFDLTTDVHGQVDRLSINAQLNRTEDRLTICRHNLGRCEPQRLEGGVAVFNLPDFGQWYIDASPEEREHNAVRLSGGALLAYRGDIRRDSMFEDVVRIFDGIEYVIASGGARCPAQPKVIDDNSEWILKEADRLGFDLVQEITITEPKTGHFGGTDDFDLGPVVSVQVEFLTYIFKRRQP